MMEADINWIYYLLLAANTLFGGAAALAILRAQRLTSRQESFWKSTTGAALTMQPGPEEMLRAIDRRVQALVEEFESARKDANKQSPATRGVPFENAVRMARHGASMDDLTRTCGLNASEARLLMRVHGRQQPAAQAS